MGLWDLDSSNFILALFAFLFKVYFKEIPLLGKKNPSLPFMAFHSPNIMAAEVDNRKLDIRLRIYFERTVFVLSIFFEVLIKYSACIRPCMFTFKGL